MKQGRKPIRTSDKGVGLDEAQDSVNGELISQMVHVEVKAKPQAESIFE